MDLVASAVVVVAAYGMAECAGQYSGAWTSCFWSTRISQPGGRNLGRQQVVAHLGPPLPPHQSGLRWSQTRGLCIHRQSGRAMLSARGSVAAVEKEASHRSRLGIDG